MRTRFGRSAGPPPDLGLYEAAYLAGGPPRVTRTALITLRERGLVTITGARVRAVVPSAEDPVERAVLARCREERNVSAVADALLHAPEVAAAGRRLVAYGLLTRYRRLLTAEGRRCLEDLRDAGAHPGYVFDGPFLRPVRRVRRTLRRQVPRASTGERDAVNAAGIGGAWEPGDGGGGYFADLGGGGGGSGDGGGGGGGD